MKERIPKEDDNEENKKIQQPPEDDGELPVGTHVDILHGPIYDHLVKLGLIKPHLKKRTT